MHLYHKNQESGKYYILKEGKRYIAYIGKRRMITLKKAEQICKKKGLTLEELKQVKGLKIKGLSRRRRRFDPKEYEIRDKLAEFISQINYGLSQAHEILTTEALEVARACKGIIAGLEEGKSLEEMMELFYPLHKALCAPKKIAAKLWWEASGPRLVPRRVYEVEGVEGTAYQLASTLMEYIEKAADKVKLGVCKREKCGKLYLKPKFGEKRRYCSESCRQLDYQARRAQKQLGS